MRSFAGWCGGWIVAGCLLSGLLLTVAGCSGSNDVVGVSGKITYNGQPAPAGAITFQPVPGQPEGLQPASSAINPDGTYAMTSAFGNGVQPGKYRVAIACMEPVDLDNPVQKWLVPQKFANPETSGLTIEVPATSSSMKHDIDLHD